MMARYTLKARHHSKEGEYVGDITFTMAYPKVIHIGDYLTIEKIIEVE